jgi:hypothetical protein
MAGLRFCSLTTFYPPFNFGGDGIFYDTSRQVIIGSLSSAKA